MNRQRGMSTVGAVLLAATAGLLTATLMMDWMVVTRFETAKFAKGPRPAV